ncbi:class I SAM-dependent methyltransferase [Ruegeria sp. AU67]|uniref:class I SAM-dependent methyltransferase n=1 Tax=Ruegeria sp. AU67 TaxID=2108530 RepID=UPI000D6963C7
MTHIDHLKSICELEGIQVVDVGAGDGVYSRDLYAAGAKVTAIEIDSDKVAKAKEDLPRNIDVRIGAAGDLPLDSGSQDLASLFFSLHHIPVEVQHTAFTEISRVPGKDCLAGPRSF